MLESAGEAKAQQFIDTLWSCCNFASKGFEKPTACYYAFEKDQDTKNAQNQAKIGQWLTSKLEVLRGREQ